VGKEIPIPASQDAEWGGKKAERGKRVVGGPSHLARKRKRALFFQTEKKGSIPKEEREGDFGKKS